MKKTMKCFSALAVMVMCAFVLTACGSDSGSSAGGDDSGTFSIVGTWRYYYDSNDTSRGTVYDQITFKSDHTGTIIEEVGYGSDTPESFTWTQSGNTIRVTWNTWNDGRTDTVTIVEVVDSKTIVINNGYVTRTCYKQ